jgi:hypothetical protein
LSLPANNISLKKKVTNLKFLMDEKDYVVEFWGITLSDSEMEAVCPSEAMILTYKMTHFHTRKASIGKRFVMFLLLVGLAKTIFWATYTGCPRRNGQNFGRVFLRLNYTDITQNTYIQS